jgi:hypothetical protein
MRKRFGNCASAAFNEFFKFQKRMKGRGGDQMKGGKTERECPLPILGTSSLRFSSRSYTRSVLVHRKVNNCSQGIGLCCFKVHNLESHINMLISHLIKEEVGFFNMFLD